MRGPGRTSTSTCVALKRQMRPSRTARINDQPGRSAQGLEQRPGWSLIRAVREGRICRFSAAQVDVLVRPGPRMGEAAQIMAQCIVDQSK